MKSPRNRVTVDSLESSRHTPCAVCYPCLPFGGPHDNVVAMNRTAAYGTRSVPATSCRPRRGFTLLEFTVALLLFGVAMSGLFPLVIMYSKVLESLEQRPEKLALHRNVGVDDNTYREGHLGEWYRVGTAPYTRTETVPNAGDWVHKWYLVPPSDSASSASNTWARKLGASASIKYISPTAAPPDLVDVPTAATATNPAGVDAGVATYYVESPDSGSGTPWTVVPGTYYLDSFAHQSPTGAPGTATWTVTVAAAGWYQVQATGLVSPGSLPPNCSYAISTDSGLNWTNPIMPNLSFGQSATWQPLAFNYFNAGTVTIRLTTAANSGAIADGMRLVRCYPNITSFTLPITETATATVHIKPAMRLALP
jgi:prepilin-type N-terminal cleavage/methylation domain-containing protein